MRMNELKLIRTESNEQNKRTTIHSNRLDLVGIGWNELFTRSNRSDRTDLTRLRASEHEVLRIDSNEQNSIEGTSIS